MFYLFSLDVVSSRLKKVSIQTQKQLLKDYETSPEKNSEAIPDGVPDQAPKAMKAIASGLNLPQKKLKRGKGGIDFLCVYL